MIEQNPLRPMSRDPVLVLEVIVNGRRMTAYGQDAANLQQGGPLPELERLNTPVSWTAPTNPLPDEIRILAPDGSVTLGPLRFSDCVDPPKVAAPRMPVRSAGDGKPARAASPPVALPQGAIP